jgi:hypothetical protein
VVPWFLSLLLLAAGTTADIAVEARPGATFAATFVGPAPGVDAGEFRGSLAINGSPAEMAVAGRAEPAGSRLRLRAILRYADVPGDWLRNFRPDTFDYRIRGEVAGAGVFWAGTLRWDQVTAAADGEALSHFVELASLELTALSVKHSEGRAVLSVTNPFSFTLTVAAAGYRLRVNKEEIGSGATRGRILRAGKRNALELPFTVDHGRFLSAAGFRWAVGAGLDADLDATLTLRLPSGDVSIPLKLSGQLGTDGARSGVFSFPEGATSLSPR